MAAEVPDSGSATSDLSARIKFVPTPQPTPLRDQVAALIEPWRNTATKPPFTTGELIVMAFVVSGKEEMSDKEIHASILRTFSYYCNLAIDFLTNIVDKTRDGSVADDCDSPIDDFYDALRSSELPLQRKFITSRYSSHELYSTMVDISLPAARLYLRHRLEPERSGTFDFMGLPAELREKIHKMLLIYPGRGLSVQTSFGDYLNGLVLTPTRPGLHLDDMEAQDKHERELVCLPEMSEALSILRASKQLCSEALPIFYRNNLFHFSSLEVLQRAMSGMGREKRKMIDHMQIDFKSICHYEPSFKQGRGLATVLPDLAPQTLVLEWPAHGICMMCANDDATFVKSRTSFEQNPGLAEFVALAQRAKKLELRGDDKFKTWLEKKLAESGDMGKSDAGKVDSSPKAILEP